jgi:hypothetical protein
VIGSVGPTTSGRMDAYTPLLLQRGHPVVRRGLSGCDRRCRRPAGPACPLIRGDRISGSRP